MSAEQTKRLEEIRRLTAGCGSYQCCKESLDLLAIVDSQAQRIQELEAALVSMLVPYCGKFCWKDYDEIDERDHTDRCRAMHVLLGSPVVGEKT